tara:strand:- start:2247 stop:2873 length:627 start_codon:yes stop_codon:yes gene_type:complete
MSLDTYDNLIAEVIDWSHRDDLGPKMPDFIMLAEAAMYSNDVELLTVRSMETISTALTAGEYLSLPDYFESARSVRLITGSNVGKLEYKAPQQMCNSVSNGRPRYFTVVGNELQFDRVPDSEYTIEIQYYRKSPPLTPENQTNDILTNHPSIYLFGALAVIFGYAQDTQQEVSYINKFIGAIRGANKADKKGRYGPAAAASLARGITP